LADHLAVQGRNQQSKEVVIKLVFRAVINKKEQFVGLDTFSVQVLANIHDFWLRLAAKCGDVIGDPEGHEIWHNRCKLAKPMIEGGQYEIISRRTAGFVRPSEILAQRRSPIDLRDPRAALGPSGPKAREAPHAVPPVRRSEQQADRDLPMHVRAYVTFQDRNQPENEWRGWFTGENTEDSIEPRAYSETGGAYPSGETTKESGWSRRTAGKKLAFGSPCMMIPICFDESPT
jgi:hypothetical protein